MNDLYELRLQQYADDAETKHQMEMDDVDERKSNQIMKLIEEHEDSFANMRNYYTDITQNNLTLIGSLKLQMEELSAQFEKSERQLKKVIRLHHFIVYTFRFVCYYCHLFYFIILFRFDKNTISSSCSLFQFLLYYF